MKLDGLDIEIIAEAMYLAARDDDRVFYLDTQEGMVTSFSSDTLITLERMDRAQMKNLSDEKRDEVLTAGRILLDEEDCFFPIPAIETIDEFHWMSDFSELVSSPEVYEALREALNVSNAMENFRRVLERSPVESRRWEIFLSRRKCDEALAWTRELGLDANGGESSPASCRLE